MLLKYVLFFVGVQICWSHSIIGKTLDPQITPYLENADVPLILTPLIESGDTEKALNLSTVPPFLNSSIVSHSGYFTVNKTYNSNLFFWFFHKNGDWKKAPLLLWLQGGPGISSLYGLFNENGPYVYTKPELQLRNTSWTNDYNVLYIDQPVGTGFSFTDSPSGYINTQEEVADHLYEALTQFFHLFPDLKLNEFYITGQSYAGKFVPAISYKIHTMKMANLTNINLKGLFMISAFTDGLVNGLANFCFQVGIIDSRTKAKLEETEEMIELFVRAKRWKNASILTFQLLDLIKNGSDVSLFDFRRHLSSEMEEWQYVEFLQSSEVGLKIHVGNKVYQNKSLEVFNYFVEDRAKSVVRLVGELLDNGYSIAFVGGQYDVIRAHPLVANVLKKLEWNGAIYFRNITQRDRLIVDGFDGGYYTSYGRLTDILIRGAGHTVSRDQPKLTLATLNRFINGKLSNATMSYGIH